MKKHLVSLCLVAAMMCATLGTTSMAAEAESPKNEESGQLYTTTVEVDLSSLARATSSSTKYASSDMGLALNPGETSWSNSVNFRFSLPSNATIESIEFERGRAVSNSSLGGAVVPRLFQVTAPDRTSATYGNIPTVTDRNSFSGSKGNGTWSASFYGENLSSSGFGSLTYKSAKLTITYRA